MFSDPVSFNGGTRFEVIAVLANCGRDTDRAKRALVTWIQHKQEKGRSTQHILSKLQDIESKFIKDISLHSAFRDARAETFLPRAADIPLPYPTGRTSGMQMHTPESPPTRSPNARHNVTTSLLEGPVDPVPQSSPAISPLRLSRDSSQMSESSGKSHTSRRSLPPDVLPVPSSSSPHIQIPGERSLKPGPSSPIPSSPEDSGLHYRHRLRSNSAARVYQSHGLPTPPPTSPPEFSLSPSSFRQRNTDTGNRGVVHGLISSLPSPRIQIPQNRPRRGTTATSPPYSSSEESDFHPKYRPLSQPARTVSPGGLRTRVTPPMTTPPNVPLPPLPTGIQGVYRESTGGAFRQSLPAKHPHPHSHYPIPVQSPAPQPPSSSSAVRPLPIQPIPSPVPDSDESVTATDIMGESASQHRWEANSQLSIPSDVVRGDSPLYIPNDDSDDAEDDDDDHHNAAISPSSTGTGPPSYADYLDTYFPPDMPTVPTIDGTLDRAIKVCGDSPEVRLEVSRCIEFQRGYEPPYWQTRLQACGLNVEAAKYLVDEMCGKVDWSASASPCFGSTSKKTR